MKIKRSELDTWASTKPEWLLRVIAGFLVTFAPVLLPIYLLVVFWEEIWATLGAYYSESFKLLLNIMMNGMGIMLPITEIVNASSQGIL